MFSNSILFRNRSFNDIKSCFKVISCRNFNINCFLLVILFFFHYLFYQNDSRNSCYQYYSMKNHQNIWLFGVIYSHFWDKYEVKFRFKLKMCLVLGWQQGLYFWTVRIYLNNIKTASQLKLRNCWNWKGIVICMTEKE